MEVETHDRALAAISHLPHMVAYSLVNAVGSYDRYEENILEYSAGGFRDFTRIASSDPTMWRDIALANREALLAKLDALQSELAGMRRMLEAADGEGLLHAFAEAKAARDAWLETHGGGL